MVYRVYVEKKKGQTHEADSLLKEVKEFLQISGLASVRVLNRYDVEKIDEDQFWHNIGFVDTLTHAARMNYPVLLTLGTKDASCPPECVQTLYDVLDTDKMLLSMKNRGHGYQYEFVRHTLTWFSLYA